MRHLLELSLEELHAELRQQQHKFIEALKTSHAEEAKQINEEIELITKVIDEKLGIPWPDSH